jgi:hypothetical protein
MLALAGCGRMRFADFGGRSSVSGTDASPRVTVAKKITLSGATSFPALTCNGLTIRTQDEDSNDKAVSADTPVILRTSADGTFHTASDCSAATRTNSVTLPAGESSLPVYYFPNRGGETPVFIAEAPTTTLTQASLPVVADPAPIHFMEVLGPRAATINTCAGPYRLQLQNADHLPEISLVDAVAAFTLGAGRSMFTDSGCLSSATSLTIPARQSSATFYLRSISAGVETFTATVTGPFNTNISAQVSFSSRYNRIDTVAGKINPSGFRDGDGISQARLYLPGRMTNDGTHVYFTDGAYERIRRYTPSTRQVVTVVGNSADQSSPLNRDGYGPYLRTGGGIFDLTADATHLYFTHGSCIRRMNLSTWMVDTLIGDCQILGNSNGIGTAARLPWLNHLRIDPVLRRLYSSNNSGIWQTDLDTLNTRLIAGDATATGNTDGVGLAARFDLNQGGLHVQSDGSLIVGEFSQIKLMNTSTYAMSTVQTSVWHQENMVQVGSWIYAFNSAQTEYLRKFQISPAYTSSYEFMNMIYVSRDGGSGIGSITGGRGLTAIGNILYFTEQHTHLLRQADIDTGVITTLAGSNGFDYGGTDAASLRGKNMTLIAGSGTTLYFGDKTNCNIRKIDTSTGAVTLIAGDDNVGFTPSRCVPVDGTGGPGGTARFSDGIGTGALSGSYLYVGDGGRIRRIDLSAASLDVVTLAGSDTRNPITDGTGAAAILQNANFPTIIGTSLYFGDNYAVRKLDLLTNGVTTLAGEPSTYGYANGPFASARFSAITGIAVRGAANQLVVTDQFTVRVLDLTTQTVSSLAGTPGGSFAVDGNPLSSMFNQIRAMTFYYDIGAGDEILFIYDGNGIREFNTGTGTVSSLSGYTQNYAVYADQDGLLHSAGVSPAQSIGYFKLVVLADGALYFPTGQGIRKVY